MSATAISAKNFFIATYPPPSLGLPDESTGTWGPRPPQTAQNAPSTRSGE
ncbi:MAG: hypothetical protein AVDCRST_MAG02-2747 [uncultured Rubrobacteraceae bacterium]|uniref:Uncharacterized protein n=1 Tax=uncultured Rubrobacteraceae bacterium TaxID=349277 RepID=A0A6J4R3N8_9ACTN|nr:MAG: hypothetical protein AVDCRST_MAG02-2747 [uncultured Rubrobacteraceae bacterium]